VWGGKIALIIAILAAAFVIVNELFVDIHHLLK